MNESTYGVASWYDQYIILNENAKDSIVTLNDVEYPILSVVLIHEILHIFGLVGLGLYGFIYIRGEHDTPPNVYTGKQGVAQYKNVLRENEMNVDNIGYLPIENDFEEGTVRTHLEEGKDDEYKPEKRYINDVHYPVITNEIMTGFINRHNYFTPITLGILEDLGFVVNYESIYVTSIGEHLHIL
tara:strand:- start:7201 stop:7755 length:555 start_codon:yes stop_codon:yes gene_type:complete